MAGYYQLSADSGYQRMSGAFQCLYDQYFTLTGCADSFYIYLGYGREEFEEKYHGRIINVIYEEDRKTVIDEIKRQLAGEPVFMVENRIVTHSGELRWVRVTAGLEDDQDGPPGLHCIFFDITEAKLAELQMAVNEQRYEIVHTHTQDIVFELDLSTMKIYYSPNFEKKFGYTIPADGFPDSMFATDVIYEKDKEGLREQFKLLLNGADSMEHEYRLKMLHGAYIWVEVHAKVIRDGQGKGSRILGVIKDINGYKQELQEIRRTAVLDPLTNLYNRREGIRQIEKYISHSRSVAAFLLIDLDNFKMVNDTMGHACGDMILQEIAAGLRTLTRQSDILARLGGDEFIVFMTHIDKRENAIRKINDIFSFFNQVSNGGETCSISCSIGCSLYPEDGNTFSVLYQKADAAMYHVKKHGKSQYAVFEEGKVASLGRGSNAFPIRNMQKSFHDQIIEYVFRVFLENPENNLAIPLLLEYIGRVFHADRIYICERSDDNSFLDTFCWSAEGVLSLHDSMAQASPPRDWGEGGKDEMITIGDTSQISEQEVRDWFIKRGVLSAAACFLREQNQALTIIIYEDCHGLRHSNEEEKYTLFMVSQIIHLFLNKERNGLRIQKEGRERINFLMNCIAGGMTGCYLEKGFPLYFINQRMLEFLGYQSQEEYARAVGGLAINAVLPEDRERLEAEVFHQLKERNEYETEFRMIKKDGTIIWINEKGKRTMTLDGRQSVIGLLVDISLQKEYEKQLALYRKTASGAFIILIDDHFTLRYGNDIFYSMFEITKEEMALRGFHGSSLVYPEDLPVMRDRLEEAARSHSADFQLETRVVTGQGNTKWFLINGTFEYQKEGPILNGFVIDLTENHLLKQEIIHKELVYRTALNETQFKVWEYDVKGHALLISGRMKEEYLFKDRVEHIPESLIQYQLVHPGSQQDLIDLYRQLDEGKSHAQADILSRYKTEDPWIWQRIRYTMLYDKQGTPSSAVAVVEDITRQKEAEMQYQQDLQLRMAFNDSLIASFRCNLYENRVEYAEGPDMEQFMPGMSYEELMEFHNRSMANQEDAIRLKKLMGRKSLMKAYKEGKSSLSFEYRRRDSSGKLFWVCASIRLVRDAQNGKLYAYGTLQDINEKKVMELTMKNRAEHDMLTGAYNKDTAIQLITDSLKKAHRQKSSCAFLLFHVDHFAQIVHECGYGVADAILKEVASQLLQYGKEKIIGKFYGEEFVVYIYNNPQPEMVKRYARQVRNAISLPYMFPDSTYPVTLSVGIAFDNSPKATFDSLYRKARLALTASKASDEEGIFNYSQGLEEMAFSQEADYGGESGLTSQGYSNEGVNLLIKCMYSITSPLEFKQSLENILKELGSYYQGDRVYVIEMERKKQEVRCIYEWHRDDVLSISESSSMLLEPRRIFKELSEQFQSLCYESDVAGSGNLHPEARKILEELEIHSYFIATLNEGKHPIGYIGIDNPVSNRNDRTIFSALRYILANELTKYRLQEKQRFLSCHDELTGLLNRYSFREYRGELEEEGLISMGVVSMDINGLKRINQKHGNAYGDDIVRYAGKAMDEVFPYWQLYRLAGDEFLIVCENISSEAFNQKTAELKKRLDKVCSVSLGSAWRDVDIHLDSLINSADEKRMIAKQIYYNEIGFDSGRRNDEMRKKLLLSMEQNRFSIYLQPKVDSRTGDAYGAEALIRYYDSVAGLVPPGKFVPYLENAGLIHYIDFFVLEEVCKTLKHWENSGLSMIPVSLNFSRSTLLEDHLIDRMEEVAGRWGTNRDYLEIEITESLGEVENDAITRIGNQIEAAGYRIALDDFGAKYSNISFLSVLRFNHLKLDKGLVNNLMTNQSSRLIVKNILNLCRELDINVIAEGVESQEQLEILKELGCYYIQGYYYDKPVTVSAFEERYQKKRNRL